MRCIVDKYDERLNCKFGDYLKNGLRNLDIIENKTKCQENY